MSPGWWLLFRPGADATSWTSSHHRVRRAWTLSADHRKLSSTSYASRGNGIQSCGLVVGAGVNTAPVEKTYPYKWAVLTPCCEVLRSVAAI